MILIDNLFWIGLFIVLVALVRNQSLARNYSVQRARSICLLYFLGLLGMTLGVSGLAYTFDFQGTWWETGGQIFFGIFAFGSFLEIRKMLPLAPAEIQKAAEDAASEAKEDISKAIENQLKDPEQ